MRTQSTRRIPETADSTVRGVLAAFLVTFLVEPMAALLPSPRTIARFVRGT
jgi:hypothetical protein